MVKCLQSPVLKEIFFAVPLQKSLSSVNQNHACDLFCFTSIFHMVALTQMQEHVGSGGGKAWEPTSLHGPPRTMEVECLCCSDNYGFCLKVVERNTSLTREELLIGRQWLLYVILLCKVASALSGAAVVQQLHPSIHPSMKQHDVMLLCGKSTSVFQNVTFFW